MHPLFHCPLREDLHFLSYIYNDTVASCLAHWAHTSSQGSNPISLYACNLSSLSQAYQLPFIFVINLQKGMIIGRHLMHQHAFTECVERPWGENANPAHTV